MQRRSRCTKTNNLELKAHCCHGQSLCVLARSPLRLSHSTVCFGKKEEEERTEWVVQVFWSSECVFYVTADQLEKEDGEGRGPTLTALFTEGCTSQGQTTYPPSMSRLTAGRNWSWHQNRTDFKFQLLF